jgi:predicted metal-dependent phosphoesterase TrpH
MTPKADPLLNALKLPGGARFYKCALPINPHHYSTTYRGKPAQGNAETHARQVVDKAAALGVSVLAVTDHNHVSGVALIREAAKDRDIHVLPGFELSTSEGVHVLCIYPPDTDEDRLGRYLGEFGIRNTDQSSQPSNKTFTDILRCVREQGGVTIAAHVTNDGGLFRVLSGQARIRAWKDDNLLAVQIPGPVDDLPQDVRSIVENKNADYRRPHVTGNGLAVAVVNAGDVAAPGDLDAPSATCWIKMSEVGVEGLRQAFLDPGSRIRLNSAPTPEDHAEFVTIAWEGGFLDGAAIHFNENLNVLVGGRGTGKSTVIESLRYVLGLDPLGEDARKAHEGIVRHVLGSGTKISLLLRSHRLNKQEYRIERTIPNPPVVRDQNGNIMNLAPSAIAPQVEVFGQHEISELTKSPEKRTRLLERFVERDAALAQRKADVRRQLEQSRTKILDSAKEVLQVEERLAALPALEETLKRFQDAGLEERLKEQSLLVREEQVLKTSGGRLTPYRELLGDLRRALPIDRAFVAQKALEGLPGREILAEIETVLSALNRELDAVAKRLQEALDGADQRLASVKTKWEVRKKEVQAAYEKILRELQKSKVDGEEFIRLRRQIEELRPLRERQAILQRTRKEHEDRRRSLLAEWEDAKAEEFRQLERAAKKVSKQLAERVRVQVTFAGNREPLFLLLKEQVRGRLSETLDAFRDADSLSLKELSDAWRAGRDTLVQKYKLPSAQADRLAQAPSEVVMQLEELDLAPTTQIELNVAAEGQAAQWQRLEDLSTGQKATAVLLLLLLESDAPLVVDQPEDDLDNRFITEGVVPKMREEKRRRQFVFATHNANIPVLGDAELIVGLTATGEAGQEGKARMPKEHMGSIDARSVRELVEEVLEGGREAFEMRRLKYGF